MFFFINPDDADHDVAVRTVISGGAALWHGWTGAITPLAAVASGQGAMVHFTLPAHGSVFLVIDPAAQPAATTAPAPQWRKLAVSLDGWQLQASGFDAARKPVVYQSSLPALSDWRQIPALATLAGTGRYQTRFTLGGAPGGHVMLDLGAVGVTARVSINGCTAGLVMPPYRVDITNALRAGGNQLEITVANTPINALAHQSVDHFMKFGGPEPAGLMGPIGFASAQADDPDMTHLDCGKAR